MVGVAPEDIEAVTAEDIEAETVEGVADTKKDKHYPDLWQERNTRIQHKVFKRLLNK
jgi:hypothetical protein